MGKLANLQEGACTTQRRLSEIQHEIAALQGELVTEDEVATNLAAFEPVWESLTPREQARVIQMLVERVDFDGDEESVSITFRPTGIRALGSEFADHDEEDAA